MGNVVAIVGRPNVGKSTLFNRLIGERKSIVDDISGVTRDRIYGFSDWNGKHFSVIDTGGFVKGSDDIFEAAIRSQVAIAIEEATVIVFMADVTTGITDLDDEIADMLRKGGKPVICVVNKVDNSQRDLQANEFWALGFENTIFLSSMSGSGTGELLDMVVDFLPESEEESTSELPRIAIVGQPNVGKSSLTNALLGEERNIVTDIPGTTRDSIYIRYDKFDKQFFLIDTAGIRKKSRVHEDLEFYSVIRALNAIEEADVCILMLDASLGLESQDMSIMSLILKRKKGLVILVNKWDLIEKETNTARDFEKDLKERIAPFTDVPIVFTSVVEKQRIFKAMEIALEVAENRVRKVKTSELNDVLLPEIERTAPPAHRGRFIKIKYITQLPLHYPAFAFFCNHPKHIKPSYRNFLENKIRQNWNFAGVPIHIFFREK
ncbi:MAG: ribosome biogenesis GTPase Der [Saprospiraceae bacterium]|nr:ribosome biogenesis GTPase Der [Saprospiraceae bacterium]MBK8635964.1 ribosome biogenesis GTPase Der [Saprospiraceae bacterium]